MGRILLVARLAARNLRRRPVEAALLVLAVTAAATTLAAGRVLEGVTDSPYERTREATAGADVVASVSPTPAGPPTRGRPADPAELTALVDAPGVADHGGPYPAAPVQLAAGDLSAVAWAEGRPTSPGRIDRPHLTDGRWLAADGQVVVEAAFADALGVGAGDRVTLQGRSFEVAGVATTATAPYTDTCYGWMCWWLLAPDRAPEGPPGEGRPVGQEGPAGSGDAGDDRGAGEPAGAGDDGDPGRSGGTGGTGDDGDDGTVPILPAQPDAGLVWVTDADARSLAGDDRALSYVLHLTLDDPSAAPAFARQHATGTWEGPFLGSWQDLRAAHDRFVHDAQEALTAFAGLLTLLAIASVAVLVGGRMADQTRRVGLLKAAGGTPGLVAAVLLAEYLVLAVVGAAVGLLVGWWVAPRLGDPGAGLLGSAGTPSLTWGTVGLVTAVALGIAVVAALVPALRAARTSTVHALADAARRPRRSAALLALSSRLPVPLLLGLRVIARRPRRVVLNVAGIVVTVSGIVAVLGARAAMAGDWQGDDALDPVADRASQVLAAVTTMLVLLAAVNAVVVTWASAVDSRHSSALARALGATPGQVGVGLSAAQVVPAVVGAVLGIPGGLALWAALADGDGASPTGGQLVAVVVGTGLVAAILAAIPSALAIRHPPSPILRSDAT